jgi:type IV secretory pathway VirB2 component (pilin)
MFSLGKYSKFWIALIGAIVSGLTLYFGSNEWITILVTFLSAIGVFASPNTPVIE